MIAELDFNALKGDKAKSIAEHSATGTMINFGWLPPHKLTEGQLKVHSGLVSAMPKFAVRGRFMLESRRYALWKFTRQLLLGKDPNWIWQQTGSCVGAGGGNMTIVSQGVEIVLKGDREEFKWPWWLFTYGKSRQRAGISGRGEGSFGSAWAEAALRDGQFELDPAGEPDLPDPTIKNGWAVSPASLELEWSHGAVIKPNWSSVGAKHLFKTASPIKSADQAIDALSNGYAITQASSFGFNPMVPPIEGRGVNAVRLVRRWNAVWNHQTWVDEYWDNPDVGPVFRWGNNWGPFAHNPNGETPNGEPNNGVYITYDIMDRICKHPDSEVYAFSSFDGFPARESLLRELDFNPVRS